MKTKKILSPFAIASTIFSIVIFSSFDANNHKRIYHNEGGTASSCGSPGELGTCSRPGCHGAGASPAGVADNAGPGSLVLTAVPALTGNQYVPGTTYKMSVTISQTGKKRFGFGCEILDNSGQLSTDKVNNTAGTVVVTDHVNTRIWQAFGTGRLSITQDTNGGFASNPYTFNFNWIAPAKGYGTVNVYLCGNAADNNLLADSGDYVYSQHIVLTENTATGLNNISESSIKLNVYPNPANSNLTVSFNLPEAGLVESTLYSVNGEKVKAFENSELSAGEYSKTYNVNGLSKGIYLLKIVSGNNTETKKIIIE